MYSDFSLFIIIGDEHLETLYTIYYYLINISIPLVLIYLYYLNICKYKKLSVLLDTSWKSVMIKTIILITAIFTGSYVFFASLTTLVTLITGPDANLFVLAAPTVILILSICLFVQTLLLKKLTHK